MRSHALRGLAIVVALLVIVTGVEPFVSWVERGDMTASLATDETLPVSAEQMWEFVQEGRTLGASQNLPSWFQDELFSLSEVRSYQATNDESLVGITTGDSAEDVIAGVERAMAERGWTEVKSGQPGIMTFIRDNEALNWAFVQVQEVGSATSVLVGLERGGSDER